MQAQQVLRHRFPGMEVVPSTYPVSPQKASCIPSSDSPPCWVSSNLVSKSYGNLRSDVHQQTCACISQSNCNLGPAGELTMSEGPWWQYCRWW